MPVVDGGLAVAVTAPPVAGAVEPVMTAASDNALGAGLVPGLGLIDGLGDGLGLVSVGEGVGVAVGVGEVLGVVGVTLGVGLWLGVTEGVQLGDGLAVALGLAGIIGAGVVPACRGSQTWFGGTILWPLPLTPPPPT